MKAVPIFFFFFEKTRLLLCFIQSLPIVCKLKQCKYVPVTFKYSPMFFTGCDYYLGPPPLDTVCLTPLPLKYGLETNNTFFYYHLQVGFKCLINGKKGYFIVGLMQIITFRQLKYMCFPYFREFYLRNTLQELLDDSKKEKIQVEDFDS